MKAKKKKKFFVQKSRTLKVYENLSLELTTQIKLANAWNAESFLASDMSYHGLLEKITLKIASQWDQGIGNALYVSNQQGLWNSSKIKVEPISLEEQQRSLLAEAYEALNLYKETHLQEHLREYIKLFSKYKELLQRVNEKFKKLIGKIKANLRGLIGTDIRAKIRCFIRLILPSSDDEDNSVESLIFLFIKSFIKRFYFNETTRNYRHYKQPEILFRGN